MNDSNLEKPTKSLLWIVATIWANIIIVFLLVGIALLLLRGLLIQLLGLDPRLVGIFMVLVVIGAVIYAIRLGVKTVVKKSVITEDRIFKISLWVGLVDLFLRTGLLLLVFYIAWLPDPLIDLPEAIKLLLFNWGITLLISFGYFGLTYCWCKKLIK